MYNGFHLWLCYNDTSDGIEREISDIWSLSDPLHLLVHPSGDSALKVSRELMSIVRFSFKGVVPYHISM